MQKNSTLVHDMAPEEIAAIFAQLLNKQLSELKLCFQPKDPIEYLTRKEVSEMLKCDLSTVHNWTKKGKLKAYGLGNKVYYKRTEVEAVLLPL